MVTITITQPRKGSANLKITDPEELMVGSLSPARQLMIQALFSIEGEVGHIDQVKVSKVKLNLLRNFLHSTLGETETGKMRRLLLMALMQLEDEDEAKRFVKPFQGLPIVENL